MPGNNKRRWLLITILLTLPVSLPADFNPGQWQYRRQVMIFPPASGFGEFMIDEQIHRRIGLDGASIRVVDKDLQEIPYVLMADYPKLVATTFSTTVLNLGRIGDNIKFQIDCGPIRIFHNRLILDLAGDNYRLPVTVEAGPDQKQWQIIRKNAYVLKFTTDRPVQSREIDYPRCDYRFLRVGIGPGVPDQVSVNTATVAEIRAESGTMVERRFTKISEENLEPASGRQTVIVLDLGQSGLPHQEISLTITDPAGPGANPAFSRLAEIYCGDAVEGPWQLNGSGTIYRSAGASRNVVTYQESGSRYIRILIRHYDDRPLTISGISVRGVPRKLLMPLSQSPAFIYYGNVAARVPHYDLAREINTVGVSSPALTISLGDEQTNDQFQSAPPPPWLERNPWAIYAGLGLAVLLLGWLAFRQLRPATPR